MWEPTIAGRTTRPSIHSSQSSFTGRPEKTTSKGRSSASPLPSFSIPIFDPEHELPKEAFVADLLGQMRTERLSYGAGSTETMTERLNRLMTPLYT